MKKAHERSLKHIYRHVFVWITRSKKAMLAVAVLLVVIVGLGTYALQNEQATAALHTGKKLDDVGQYDQAKQTLQSAGKTLVRASTKKQIAAELARNQKLAGAHQKLEEVKRLLAEHKPAEAQKILNEVQASSPPGGDQNALASLQRSVTQQSTGSPSQTTPPHTGGSSTPPSSSGGATGSGTSTPPPGPLTNLSVVSFTASASPAGASTCNISDSVTFSSNGSGTVTTTWSLMSAKSTSQIDNPNSFTFATAGSQSDSFNFSGTQGLESGDAYRVSVTITSTTNAAITVTTTPVTINSCAGPPGLAAEQAAPLMTTITPVTPSVYQYQDGIFSNECSIQVTTPYSVNSSGTVEAIVMVTSGSSVGYTYYDKNGTTAFSGPGSTSDTSYFRLPHLAGGGPYTIVVKLVEVSAPGTVYATTTPISSGCN